MITVSSSTALRASIQEKLNELDGEQTHQHDSITKTLSDLSSLLLQVNQLTSVESLPASEVQEKDIKAEEGEDKSESLHTILQEVMRSISLQILSSDEGIVQQSCLLLADALHIPSLWDADGDLAVNILNNLLKQTENDCPPMIQELCGHVCRRFISHVSFKSVLLRIIEYIDSRVEAGFRIGVPVELLRVLLEKWPLGAIESESIAILQALKTAIQSHRHANTQLNAAQAIWIFVNRFPKLGDHFVKTLSPTERSVVSKSTSNPNLRDIISPYVSRIQLLFRRKLARVRLAKTIQSFMDENFSEQGEKDRIEQRHLFASKLDFGVFYDDEHVIGIGNLSKISYCRERLSRKLRVSKNVQKRNRAQHDVLSQEYAVISRLDSHPNIVSVIDAFELADSFKFVLDVCAEGTLFEVLSRLPVITESMVRDITRQLLEAVVFLHERGVIACDISPSHLLVVTKEDGKTFSENFVVKLTVFSLSKHLPQPERNLLCPLVSQYSSLEVQGGSRYSFASDMWSVGCILYQLLLGKPPFEPGISADTPLDFASPELNLISNEAKNLMSELLNSNPDKRPRPSSCLSHEWFKLDTNGLQLDLSKTRSNLSNTTHSQRQTSRLTGRLYQVKGTNLRLSDVSVTKLGKARYRALDLLRMSRPIVQMQEMVLPRLEEALRKLTDRVVHNDKPDNPLRFLAERLREGAFVKTSAANCE